MKAGIIGIGKAGKEHVKAYQTCGVEIAALCDIDTDKLELYGKALGVEYISEDARDITDLVDIVSVCSYDQHHMTQAYEALMKGKAVMCEKPPCISRDQMDVLRNASEGKFFAVNLPLPWDAKFTPPGGEVYNLELAYHWGRSKKLLGWRSGNYSLVLGGGLHMIDLGLYMTGLTFENGAAFGSNLSTGHGNFDTVQAAFSLSNGGVGRLTVDGGYDGIHEHVVRISTSEGVTEIRNTEEVDKQRPITEFISMVGRGEVPDNTRLWRAMETCFQIEASAWSQ